MSKLLNIQTINFTPQTLTSNSKINLGKIDRKFTCNNGKTSTFAYENGTTSLAINQCGYYLINATINAQGTACGSANVQMQQNGNTILGASATDNISAIGNYTNLSFSKIIRVMPNCQLITTNIPSILTFSIYGVGLTIGTVNIAIVKIV